MGTTKALSPQEASAVKKETMPEIVLETFNKLIVKNFNGKSSTVFQDDVMKILCDNGLDQGEIYSNHWLDIEDIYRDQGWSVRYDKPDWNSSGRAYFEFKVK